MNKISQLLFEKATCKATQDRELWKALSHVCAHSAAEIVIYDGTTFFANFLSITSYELKVTFGYIGESPEYFMRKYTQEV